MKIDIYVSLKVPDNAKVIDMELLTEKIKGTIQQYISSFVEFDTYEVTEAGWQIDKS